MRIFNNWNFKKHFIFSLTMLAAVIAVRPLLFRRQAASIGIIGGADGPTAIYIAGKISAALMPVAAFIIFFIVMLLSYKIVKSIIERRR